MINFFCKHKNTLINFIFSLSLANLYYIRVWNEVLENDPVKYYMLKSMPSTIHIVAVMTDVLLCSVIIFLVSRSFFKIKNINIQKFIKVFFLLSLSIPLVGTLRIAQKLNTRMLENIIKTSNASMIAHYAFYFAFATLALIVIYLSICKLERVFKIAKTTIIILSPFVIIIYFNACMLLLADRNMEVFNDKLPAKFHEKPKNRQRFVWIIFDELDQRLAFEENPEWLHLDNLKKLIGSSLYCTQAYPPYSFTEISIPALTLGKLITKDKPTAPNEIEFTLKDSGSNVEWSKEPNIFGLITKNDLNVALIGWALPYGRILGDSVSKCIWYEDRIQQNSNGDTLLTIMLNQTRSLFETPRFSVFGQSLVTQKSIIQYKSILQDSLNLISDKNYALVYVHFPLPHGPRIFNWKTKEISGGNDYNNGYFDNLALVDLTVAEVSESLKKAGLWNNTALLVTSDHSWRHSKSYDKKSDPRVPFILKLPHQTTTVKHSDTFNTIVTGEIIQKIILDNTHEVDQITKLLK